MFKKIFLPAIILALAIFFIVYSQVIVVKTIFGEYGLDTLFTADSIKTSEIIWLPTSQYIKGSMSLFGYTKKDSCDSADAPVFPDSTLYIYIKRYHNMLDTTDCSPLFFVDAITVQRDCTEFEIPVSGKYYWTRTRGYQLFLVPADTGNFIPYKMKAITD